MTPEQIKNNVIDFVSKMANEGAEPADQLTAINLLIECSLKSVTPIQRTKIASIYFDTIRGDI